MSASDAKIVNQENKNFADIMTWREYEALRNEMRREFRTQDDELRGTVQGISQKLDGTNETVTTMKDQMTDIQRSLQVLQLAVDNLTQQQQQQEAEDPDHQDEAPCRGVGRGNRGRGFVELGRHDRGFEEEDGLGKPKFSIPKFERGADVEEYHTWELKIEKLWRLHDHTEDRKVKLASSKFDGYTLHWWDGVTHTRQEDNELPVRTWRVKTVDEYFMEMEMLMQRGRVLSTSSSKPVSNVSNTKRSEPAASSSGSSMSTVRNRDMACHTCGGKGHFKRDCPNRKVMIINEDNAYDTGDDVDPYAPEDDDYDTDGVDAYPSDARTIVVSQRALIVLPSASTQRCNLFQTKALVGPDKACKVHFREDRFPKLRKSKLLPRGAGPYKVLAKINDNAYSIDIPIDEFGASNSFNVADLTPYDGEDLGASRSTPFEGGEMMRTSLPQYYLRHYKLKMILYEEEPSIAQGGEEQLDKKMDVKLDMELDMKTSHGDAREEREACTRGGDSVQAGARPGPTGCQAGSVRSKPNVALVPAGHYPVCPEPSSGHHPASGPI
ncbi:hypothetical protein QYE76_000299 [Lolium multiflorum]|uniref:CCHC-type domain-containing protein n=1 Tax=Lolium multiflorum TaxID=4521 RepID=A0AAD8VXJ4_LOLMU|nr:hypothetical protein QYE76_000299 [Lolium multiflorum]